MRKSVLTYLNKLEGYKSAIKQFHWGANNLSQHQLCDEIAEAISDFQDTVSEIEQSMSGKFKLNKLKPEPYKCDTLKGFAMDVVESAKDFLKVIESLGENYVGMKSEVETFIGVMQKQVYLINFTLQEEVKRELMREAMYKNVPETPDMEVDKFLGKHPKTIKSRINQIYKIVHKYGLDSRRYHDDYWKAITDYDKVISSLGCEFSYHCENGGYSDYDETDNMPRSKVYNVAITYDDGMKVEGYVKMMAAGTVEDPFESYDTCIILWPKQHNVIECTIGQLKQLVSESARMALKKLVENT